MSVKHGFVGKGTQDVALVAGTISLSGDVAASIQYVVSTTGVSTGTGMLMLGIQTNTARGIRVASDGTMFVSHTGTANVSVVNEPVVSISTGTSSVIILAQPIGISGSATVIAMPAISGSVTPLGQPFAVYQTHVATQWNSGLVTITTSAGGVGGILKVSAANTPYVTDVIVSVDVPMNVQLRSATTAMAILYLATKGGMVASFKTPMVCTTAQSFTFIPMASGSCSVWAAGYTVT